MYNSLHPLRKATKQICTCGISHISNHTLSQMASLIPSSLKCSPKHKNVAIAQTTTPMIAERTPTRHRLEKASTRVFRVLGNNDHRLNFARKRTQEHHHNLSKRSYCHQNITKQQYIRRWNQCQQRSLREGEQKNTTTI